jgi:adenosylcobinamide-GDP ribazoletransferase
MLGASARAGAGAVSFLTRVPVGRYVDIDGFDVARGAFAFPLVGAGVGAAAAGVGVAANHALPAFVAAALAIACAAVLTGAMHLDALADTADALGARDRENALAIMRDSRIGSFAAVALSLDVLLKVTCVATLLDRGRALGVLVAAGALSRAASPLLAVVLPYPRIEGGPGSVLTGRTSRLAASTGAAFGVGIALAAWWPAGVWLVATAAVVALAAGTWFRLWLGGATGDCLGATTELCEIAVLVVAVALA